MNARIRFWVTPEAARALSAAAQRENTDRTRYLQGIVRDILAAHRPDLDPDDYLPTPSRMPGPYRLNPSPALGYKGRWAKWTRVGFVASPQLPLLLTTIASETGDVSMASLLRRHLADRLRADVGRDVPMPPPAPGSIFSKVVHQ